jgi:hypothetical protein
MISFKHYLSLLLEAKPNLKQIEALLKNLPEGHGHTAESIQRIANDLPSDMRYVDAAVRHLGPDASDEAISHVANIARQYHGALGNNRKNLPDQFSVEDMKEHVAEHVAKFGPQTITDPFHQRKIDEAFDVFRQLNKEYNGPDSSALSHQQKIDLINSGQNKHFSMELHPGKGVSFKLRTMKVAGCLGPSGLCSSKSGWESYYEKLDGIHDSRYLTAYHYLTPTGADMKTQVNPFTGETKKASNQKLDADEEKHFNELFGQHVENERQKAKNLENKSVWARKKTIDDFFKNYHKMDARTFGEEISKHVFSNNLDVHFHFFEKIKGDPNFQKKYVEHLVLNESIYHQNPAKEIYRPDIISIEPHRSMHGSILSLIAGEGHHSHLLFNIPKSVKSRLDSHFYGLDLKALRSSTNRDAIEDVINNEIENSDELTGRQRLRALSLLENPLVKKTPRFSDTINKHLREY